MKFFFCDSKKHKLSNIDLADEIITKGTLRFLWVTHKAKYIFTPMSLPNNGKKRKGQIIISTWHGSPIKKLYLSRDENNKKYQRYVKQFQSTDFFCMQGLKPTKLLMEAFNLKESQIINSGLPRNDILFNSTEEFKINLKEKLGLPKDKKVILYCPTWRRYDWKDVFPFDINRFKKELSDEYVMLIRSHIGKHKWIDENGTPIEIFDNEFSFNGGEYPEVTHLYLISDILISDYSSAIFDFALTGKPEILYIYDYDDYKKEFGLYFDYDNFSPFPKVKTQEELLNAVKNYRVNKNEYESFVSEFMEYEQGNAVNQILDRINI